MEKANNSKFLGALGFLVFLGFMGFQGSPNYHHFTTLAFPSLLSLASLLVFVPFRKSKVKAPVGPKKKRYLGLLAFLGFLGFLASANPGFAGFACLAILSGFATGQNFWIHGPHTKGPTMPMHYKLVQKVNPSNPENPNKWYANAVTIGDITLRELSNEIAEISTVSAADTIAVLESLLQLIPRHVARGEIVRLGDFGSFIAHLSSQSSATKKDFNSSLINGLKLSFKPGKEFKKLIKNVKFKKQ
jgi:predicted histone-like DNA-binding protein